MPQDRVLSGEINKRYSSLFSTSSPALIACRFSLLFVFLDDGHSDQCEVIPHCSFDLLFSNN